MTREFSQTVEEKNAQSQPQDCHDLVPGMSQYEESQVFSEVGPAVEYQSGVPLSTAAEHHAELSLSLDRVQESTEYNRDFSPASK